MKKCSTCGESHQETFFNKDSQKKDGLNPRCKKCSRAWHHKNKARVKLYQKNYYSEKLEYHSEKSKKYRLKNRERLVQSSKAWHQENKEKAKEYRSARLGVYAAHARNRRARILSSGGTHTNEEVLQILHWQRGCCSICKDKLCSYHVDHIKPIARGGGNDRYNLQILCPRCNLSKNDSDPIDYAQRIGLLL